MGGVEDLKLWPVALAAAGPQTAQVECLDAEGKVLVRLQDGRCLPARTVASLPARDELPGCEVLLVFDNGDPERPIVVAVMGTPAAACSTPAAEPMVAELDGETVRLQARRRIELRCGKGAIIIDHSGKITIRGSHLLSRSSGPIRIKGGHVDIN